MNRVAIIGTGKIGSHLAEYLLSSNSINEIHIANRDKNCLEGRLISLQLRKYLLKHKSRVQILDFEKIDEIDLLVICIKDNYDPRKLLLKNGYPDWFPKNLRYVGLFNDLPLLRLLCDNRLKNYKGKVAVITNPVEITTFFTQHWIPNSQVFGIGASLDSARISYIIYEHLKINISQHYCIVAGEHGNEIIGVSKLWSENRALKNFTKEEISVFTEKAQKIGFEIVSKLGFTLQDCIPVFADDIEWLLGSKERKHFRSFAFSSDKSCISKPITISGNKVIEFAEYTTSEIHNLENIEDRLADFISRFQSNFDI